MLRQYEQPAMPQNEPLPMVAGPHSTYVDYGAVRA
jgi:hypothetical protein